VSTVEWGVTMSTSSSAPGPISNVAVTTGRPGWTSVSEIVGRVLLVVLFLVSGVGKIGAYSGTVAYMSSLGVPGALLPIVIAVEVLGGIAIVLGWKTRAMALLLAGFSLLTAMIFHHNFGDQIQSIMFLKNLSIAGGFLVLAANGAGPVSLDRRLQ
jgi:putative oxidoreductase